MQVIHDKTNTNLKPSTRLKHRTHMGSFSPHHRLLSLFLLGLASLVLVGISGNINKHNSVAAEELQISANTVFAVEDNLNLSITLPEEVIKLSIDPSQEGTFSTSDLPVEVSTNNFFGYTLNMYAYEPGGNNKATTSLTNADHTAEITTITAQNTTLETFKSGDSNKWGYSLDGGVTFQPITAGAAVGGNTTTNDQPASGANTDMVTFGVKINNEIPNGTYSVVLNFIATVIAPNETFANSTFERALDYSGIDTYGDTGAYVMQDMIADICNMVYKPGATDIAKTIDLIDIRDGDSYAVAKLADGKCWMLDNLRLGSKALNSGVTIDSSNTHMAEGTSFTNFPTTSTNSSLDSYTAPQINTQSVDTTGGGYSGAKYGVYYNYCAASAGTICGDSNSDSASYDICPKGWRLPTKAEADNLVSKYSSAQLLYNALHAPFSGYFYNSSLGRQGSSGNGYFWTSTYLNSTSMYGLYVSSSDKGTNSNTRRYGNSIRCVLGS